MDVLDAIKTRRSVRSYKDTPVEQEKILQVLEAGRLAPSAVNAQNWHFIVVTDKDKLALLHQAAFEQPSVKEAPCALVVCATSSRVMDCKQPTGTVNCSIAMSYMILMAHTLGLGTCWLGHFKADEVKKALGIPDDVTVVTFTPLGYPAETPEAKPRKNISEVAGFDSH